MATTTETIYTHTCDVCGEKREKDNLLTLFDRSGRNRVTETQDAQVDVCSACHTRPIADLLAALDKRRPQPQQRQGVPIRQR